MNPWIITFTGKEFDLVDPQPDMFCITDIGRALSRLPRFLGHTTARRTYSVAQHSCLVSDNLPSEFQLEGLMHDAHEAYLGDIPSPVATLLGDSYIDLRDRIDAALRAWAGLPVTISPEVYVADGRALVTEAETLTTDSPTGWLPNVKPFFTAINVQDEVGSRQAFFTRWHALTR